ncbi:hypothetical protein HRbin11_01549 [bacterium HR11]|nr:hypothetical protein HRbin11_01549 [bacterium HR11]
MIKAKAKLTAKWQITLPAVVRERLGLRVGDTLEFVEEPDGTWRIRRRAGEGPFDRYIGFLQDLAGRDPDEIVREIRGHDPC